MTVVNNVTNSKKGMKDFINFPNMLYENDTNWIPTVRILLEEKFNKDKGAFMKNNEVVFFVAYQKKTPVGRITAQIDKVYNEYHSSKTGFFGYYESINEPEVAGFLIHTAEKWLKEKGCDKCMGPFNFNINDECGFQIDGFERKPSIMMPWTKWYYPDFFEGSGYHVNQVLNSFVMDNVTAVPEIVSKITSRIMKRNTDIEIKKINMKDLKKETEIILDIYNDAWSANWGFTPMTEVEINEFVNTLKFFADPRFIYILYKKGEPAACLVAIPNLNELISKTKNGKLNLSFLLSFIVKRKALTSLRVIIMGVVKKYQNLGLDILLYNEIFKDGLMTDSYRNVEMGWILENNIIMNSILKKIGAQCLNKYVLFEKDFKK